MKTICEQAALYFYGELNEKQMQAFKNHLAGCTACQKELAFLEKVQAALVPPAAPQAAVEAVLRKPKMVSFWKRFYKPVLAVVLLVGLSVWGFWEYAPVRTAEENNADWLAYVSDEIDTEYYNFVADFESFENDF